MSNMIHQNRILRGVCGTVMMVLHIIPCKDIGGLSKCIYLRQFFSISGLSRKLAPQPVDCSGQCLCAYGSWVRVKSRVAPKMWRACKTTFCGGYEVLREGVSRGKWPLQCTYSTIWIFSSSKAWQHPLEKVSSSPLLWVQGWWIIWDNVGAPAHRLGPRHGQNRIFLETSGENKVFILISSYRASLIRLDRPLPSHMAISYVAYVLHTRVYLFVLLEFWQETEVILDMTVSLIYPYLLWMQQIYLYIFFFLIQKSVYIQFDDISTPHLVLHLV